ncbi:unnamed protein product [Ilex paraguariensis]|uniref:CTLH domain-containing protein n=1 Tax=Ilex paraguariensis TaxID=185542 RepID=A0ABC8SYD1_9AQUA
MMDSTGPPKKLITMQEWEKKLAETKIWKEDMNKMVMDFLVGQEWISAAQEFQRESGTKSCIDDLASIETKRVVVKQIERGDMNRAFGTLIKKYEKMLLSNRVLFFCLEQQRLIESILTGHLEDAKLEIESFLSWAEIMPELWEEVERTKLLFISHDPFLSPEKDLLVRSRLLILADEVNRAIRTSLNFEPDPKLSVLLKMLTKVQDELDEQVHFPRINVVSSILEDPGN